MLRYNNFPQCKEGILLTLVEVHVFYRTET